MNTQNKPLRGVAVYYKNIGAKKVNELHMVNMGANVTDQEIRDYFKIGSLFNIGCSAYDLMAEVEKVEIIR
jgi:hypothetical protein